jgi:hypothetical protein
MAEYSRERAHLLRHLPKVVVSVLAQPKVKKLIVHKLAKIAPTPKKKKKKARKKK